MLTIDKGCFLTYTGIHFNLLAPTKEMISLTDICRSLAMINRFNGHTIRPYSVAEHLCRCCAVAEGEFDKEVQLEVLIHDFAESYYQDIISPRKGLLCCGCRLPETICQEMINELLTGHFSRYPEIVHDIDYRMLCTEARDICRHPQWWADGEDYSFTINKDNNSCEFAISPGECHWTVWENHLMYNLRRLLPNGIFEKTLRPR